MKGKSVWAVAAGVAFIVIVTTLVDIALHLAGVYPAMDQPLTHELCVMATLYRFIIGVGGGALTARLAPQNPLKHALILGGVGSLLGLLGVVTTWNQGLGPHWYPIALMLLAVPQCWLGGRLYTMRRR
ncbi:hypothetical protein [Hydrocarboniphaga sp.]|uniref:hypothetical protein n=1 Tax=Hydrocarboniphaga sp. TaxID=2033016 RepID=UPI003D105630